VNEASHNSLTKILTLAAVVEIGTGLVLMIDPAIVIKLLLGIEDSNVGTLLGRFFGLALLSLGVACWPGRPESTTGSQSFRAMLAYNALAALYLAFLGTIGHLVTKSIRVAESVNVELSGIFVNVLNHNQWLDSNFFGLFNTNGWGALGGSAQASPRGNRQIEVGLRVRF
jgi:hypothetical protein